MTEEYFTSETSSGAHNIFYSTWGDPQDRKIVCVHGLTGSSQDFKYVGEFLSQQGYHVIAPDMPGRGRSDFLANAADYSFEQYFKDLNALFFHLHLTHFDWLGVSMGGLLGIALAGLSASPITRLILSDVGPEVPQSALNFIVGYLTMSPVFSTIPDVVNALKQSKGTPFYRGDMTEEQWQHYARSHVRQNGSGLWARAFDPAIAYNFSKEPLGREDLWSAWDVIAQPVLALRGELSILFTEEIAQRMQQRKIGAPMSLVRIANAGHVPSLYPENQIRILSDWLKQTAA